MEAVVEFDYVAQESDELNLKKGDIILNVVKVQEGWCQGVLNEKSGMFPDNFVKVQKSTEKQKEILLPKKSNNSSVEDIRNKISNAISNPPSSYASPANNVPKKTTKRAKVLFDYEPQNEDELALEIGQVVDIINEVEPGWWEGSLGGKVGMLPSNFVEVCSPPLIQESDITGTDSMAPAADYEEVPEIKGRKVVGVGFGPNIFGKGGIVLKATNLGRSVTSVVSIATPSQPTNTQATNRSTNPTSSPINSPSIPSVASHSSVKKKPMALPEKEASIPATVLKAKVVYSYKAENVDELSLQIGDIINVLSQEVEDVGWWKGEVRGKVGVFPDNFVKLLPQQEPRVPPNKPKKPTDPPLQKPSINTIKPVHYVSSKPSEVAEAYKAKQGDFVVNKGRPKRPPGIKQEASDDSLKSAPLFNKVKKWETQDQLINNVTPSSSSSSSNSHPPPTSISPVSASRNFSYKQQHQQSFNQQPHQQQHQQSLQQQSLQQKLSKNSSPNHQVTHEMMECLQKDVLELREGLERMKRDHEKNLLSLMTEIDDEKKIRNNMQVEIDRLNKLLSTFSTLERPSITNVL